jgi:hypothetical protein
MKTDKFCSCKWSNSARLPTPIKWKGGCIVSICNRCFRYVWKSKSDYDDYVLKMAELDFNRENNR